VMGKGQGIISAAYKDIPLPVAIPKFEGHSGWDEVDCARYAAFINLSFS
jgi:hypothetical protein